MTTDKTLTPGERAISQEWMIKYEQMEAKIADALGTDERGEGLVSVAGEAHRAELELAEIKLRDEIDK